MVGLLIRRTVERENPNLLGFPKPGELIEIDRDA